MSSKQNLIAAIELGSQVTTGVVGYHGADGTLHVKALAKEPSHLFIRKGRIFNILKAQSVLSDLKKRLEEQIHEEIYQMYVGVGGMGLHSEPHRVVKEFDVRKMITGDDVSEMYDENVRACAVGQTVLHIVPQCFEMGPISTMSPVGEQSKSVTGKYLNLVTRAETTDNIAISMKECGLKVVGMPIAALALADELLTEPQRRSGCVFVDMGAETTTVAVYKNNILRHLAVIPLGGRNVTLDLKSLQIEETEAEKLKLMYGSAFAENGETQHSPIQLQVNATVSYEEFSGLVEARVEEIIANVAAQIKISQYDKSQLIGGIVVTGGASKMKNMSAAFAEYTGFEVEKIYFRTELSTAVEVAEAYEKVLKEGDYNGVLALLKGGKENCCSDMKAEKEKQEAEEQLKAEKAEEERMEEERKQKELAQKLENDERERKRKQEAEEEREKERKKKKRGEGWLTKGWKNVKSFMKDIVSD